MKKILIVEDDASIAQIEKDFLTIEGYEVKVCLTGHEGLKAALSENYDLIILDIMLPGLSGLDIIRSIRPQLTIPIMIVTAKGEETEKIRGLGLGADDYISKPFSPSELVARVNSNIAQYERVVQIHKNSAQSFEFEVGNIKINPNTMKVYVNDQEIVLKHLEFKLLYFLMENAEHVFSKEELYQRIWNMPPTGDVRTVAVHINRLREKIEDDPSEPRHIKTVWGAGYRFDL